MKLLAFLLKALLEMLFSKAEKQRAEREAREAEGLKRSLSVEQHARETEGRANAEISRHHTEPLPDRLRKFGL